MLNNTIYWGDASTDVLYKYDLNSSTETVVISFPADYSNPRIISNNIDTIYLFGHSVSQALLRLNLSDPSLTWELFRLTKVFQPLSFSLNKSFFSATFKTEIKPLHSPKIALVLYK